MQHLILTAQYDKINFKKKFLKSSVHKIKVHWRLSSVDDWNQSSYIWKCGLTCLTLCNDILPAQMTELESLSLKVQSGLFLSSAVSYYSAHVFYSRSAQVFWYILGRNSYLLNPGWLCETSLTSMWLFSMCWETEYQKCQCVAWVERSLTTGSLFICSEQAKTCLPILILYSHSVYFSLLTYKKLS